MKNDHDPFSVQAGKLPSWQGSNNPFSVQAGAIEGEDNETPESFQPGSFEQFTGFHGVQAGVIAPWMNHNNEYSVEAGEIEGQIDTMPEIHEYFGGDRYPNFEHLGQPNINTLSELPNYHSGDGWKKYYKYPQYSAAKGEKWKGFWDKIKIGTGKLTEKIKATRLEHLYDKVEYTPDEMQTMKERSGSKKSVKQWIQSEQGKNTADSLSQIAILLLNKKLSPAEGDAIDSGDSPNFKPRDDEGKTRILGMHPVTFSVVALTVLVAGVFIVKKVIKK